MKKTAAFLLVFILLVSVSITAFGENKETAGDLQFKSGLNPVVVLHSDNTFDYIIYANDMEGMTNGDLTVSFGTSSLKMVSYKKTGNYDMSHLHEENGKIYISYIYDDSNTLDNVELFVITFEYSRRYVYPSLTADNIVGTFIKSVADVVVTDESVKTPEQPDAPSTDNNNSAMWGDVDGNGKITAADARLALRISAKLDKPDERQKKAADVNGDGNVTSYDARAILRFAAGIGNFK